MAETAIRMEGLGKRFHIAKVQRKNRPMRALLTEGLAAPFRRIGRALHGGTAPDADETFWAFRDISLEIRRGEVVGIVGRNGAGKTTLLKILSRISRPTEGYADIHGRIGSLLEVGTGFHPELSGRENIYLNGAILGMRRQEITQKLDEIIEFSEIGRFIDTPIKHYSSGMTMRLAFSVAAHLEPEIMIVDEVLAVGDASFQRKCLGKMDEVSSQGRTVLFVSHNMGAVTQLCTRAVWLKDGRLHMDGVTDEVISAYLSEGSESHGSWSNSAAPDSGVETWLAEARLLDRTGQPASSPAFGDPFKIAIGYHINQPMRGMSILIKLVDARGDVVFETTDVDDSPLQLQVREPGAYVSTCDMPAHLLKPGRYHVTLMAYVHGVKIVHVAESALTFDVTARGYRMHAPRIGAVTPVLRWDVRPAGKTSDVPGAGKRRRLRHVG
ncbi:MAG: ABC transporter ATP-binding protein [Gammaproteobacteria bacterium]|nr:ABC transporter ATP-binding protein [Gammaproteobacteria bacterium]